jgi:hypothetical protein
MAQETHTTKHESKLERLGLVLESLALSPDHVRQTPTVASSTEFTLNNSLASVYLLFSFLVLLSSLLAPYMVATATAILCPRRKSTESNQKSDISIILFKHTSSSEFCALQLKFETCREGWLCVMLHKRRSTLHHRTSRNLCVESAIFLDLNDFQEDVCVPKLS